MPKVDEYHMKLEKAVIKAISIMEDVANETQDVESFKKLTVGFNKIKDLLGIGEKSDEK